MSIENHQEYLAPIKDQQNTMLEELIAWSNINSGSTNIDGVIRFRETLANKAIQLFGEDNISIKTVAVDSFTSVNNRGEVVQMAIADGLEIRKISKSNSHSKDKIKVLLLGHLDTVFSPEHSFQQANLRKTPEQSTVTDYGLSNGNTGHGKSELNLDKPVLNGPGVADLKGGLVIMLNALKAFEDSPLSEQIEWTIAFNPDEEIGSLSSNAWLSALAKQHDIGLIYEPALPNGHFAGARKGSGNFSAVVNGTGAHAGRDFHLGKNAVVAMSDAIMQLSELTGQKSGLTVNPAFTQGGGALNAVPDFSLFKFNVRFDEAIDEPWISEKIHSIIESVGIKHDCPITLHGKFGRIPKKLDDAHLSLYNAFVDCGKDLGMELAWQDTGGCCDGNNLAAAGLINIDTLGAVGGNLHNSNEFIFIESLTHRTALTALFLMKLANKEFPHLISKK